MSAKLTCEVRPRFEAVSPKEAADLFSDLADTLEMIRFIQDCGVPGFTFHSLVVRQDRRPILLLPLFETEYRCSNFVNPGTQALVEAIVRFLPFLQHLRLLGVGFVEGGWSGIGLDRWADPATLEAAWDLALQALKALASGWNTDLTAFVNFTAVSGRMLPMAKLSGFSQVAGPPFAQTRVVYTHPDHYLESLSKKTRHNLRRKLLHAQAVSVLRTRQPGPWLDPIYALYLQTCQRSAIKFSLHSRDFFKEVCRQVEEAEYVLYFVGEQLAAFGLQIVRPDRLIDKYFGMDAVLGRDYSLFFVSAFKDIEYCIAHRIPLYQWGFTEEDTKARLGAQLVPSRILFHHRHPIRHRIIAALARHLSYQPAVAVPRAQLGLGWNQSPAKSAAREAPVQSRTDFVTVAAGHKAEAISLHRPGTSAVAENSASMIESPHKFREAKFIHLEPPQEGTDTIQGATPPGRGGGMFPGVSSEARPIKYHAHGRGILCS